MLWRYDGSHGRVYNETNGGGGVDPMHHRSDKAGDAPESARGMKFNGLWSVVAVGPKQGTNSPHELEMHRQVRISAHSC